MTKVLNPQRTYTFSEIFNLRIAADDLTSDFGYTLTRKRLQLPQYQGELERLEALRVRLEAVLPYVDLSSETARREILIAPVILELVLYTQAQLRIEYPIKVTEQLQGSLDYLLRSQRELLVIEAKREDLDYGFTQLAAAMIALAQWDRTPAQPILIGALTTGQVWTFARLDRAAKQLEQGLDLYRIPDDLDALMRILVQALECDGLD